MSTLTDSRNFRLLIGNIIKINMIEIIILNINLGLTKIYE